MKSYARSFLMLGVLIGVSGCGSETSPEQREVHPAFGSVLFKGKPIPDATVRLHPVTPPADGKPVFIPRGKVDEFGSYTISTYAVADGAPAGEYRVSLSWQGPLQGLSEDEEDKLRERLPWKYTSPETSGLTVSISDGENLLPEIALN